MITGFEVDGKKKEEGLAREARKIRLFQRENGRGRLAFTSIDWFTDDEKKSCVDCVSKVTSAGIWLGTFEPENIFATKCQTNYAGSNIQERVGARRIE